MTNRDKLLNMSLYDLIMSVNCHRGCKLAVFTDEELTELCRKYERKCGECVNACPTGALGWRKKR